MNKCTQHPSMFCSLFFSQCKFLLVLSISFFHCFIGKNNNCFTSYPSSFSNLGCRILASIHFNHKHETMCYLFSQITINLFGPLRAFTYIVLFSTSHCYCKCFLTSTFILTFLSYFENMKWHQGYNCPYWIKALSNIFKYFN